MIRGQNVTIGETMNDKDLDYLDDDNDDEDYEDYIFVIMPYFYAIWDKYYKTRNPSLFR